MNEKLLQRISLLIIAISLVGFVLTYKEEFPLKKIEELSKMKFGEKALIEGRIDYVIRQDYSTQFVLNDGSGKIIVYYPREFEAKKNYFVKVFGEIAEYNSKKSFKAIKIVKNND